MTRRGQNLRGPAADRAHRWLPDVEYRAAPPGMAEAGPHRRRNVADVPAGPEPGSGPDGDPGPPGPDAAQDELLPPLVVMLAVDHGEPQHGGTTLEIGRF